MDKTNVLSIDVEDWFHILDSPASPKMSQWSSLQSRVERNLRLMLELLKAHNVKATFFWLGWVAEKHPDLVRECRCAGHEIACHGYAHLLAYKVGPKAFREDVVKSKKILEDIIGESVTGFRAAGFGITEETPWAFDEIRAAGYTYDSSIFPSARGHGGLENSPLSPYKIQTEAGDLLEFPMSLVEILGKRVSLFGGGYLRLFPRILIKWGIDQLLDAGRPLIIYLHPREIDPEQPRLPLSITRRFKSYVNLSSTYGKLQWLCENYSFKTLEELAKVLTQQALLEIKSADLAR